MRTRKKRSFSAIIFAISLAATLLVPTSPATAHHGTYEDCSREQDVWCAVDGNGGLTFWFEYHKDKCRFDATVDWGDGTFESFSNVQHLQSVYHQYTSHGTFTVVADLTGTPTQEGADCGGPYFEPGVHLIEVPSPRDEEPPTEEEPEEKARIASSTFPLATRIEKAKKQLKPLIDPMVAEYNSVSEELVMQQRALNNLAELHAFRVANVETIEGQISELRQDIADGFGREESQEMQRLKGFLRNAQLEEFAVRLRLRNKERDVEELAIRHQGLGAQLLIHSQPLQAIDFELTGMVVAAGSEKVYEVDVVSPYTRLFELTRKIREQRGIVEDLLAQKKEAFREFQASHEAASRRLAEIADLIWENALKAAAIDTASNVCDLLIAASKGGWAGVIAELTSKVYEAAFKDMIADPVGDPNPGKEAVEAWFRETVTGTVGVSAAKVGFERTVKETGVKLVKDFVADALADEFPGLRPIDAQQGVGPSVRAHALQRARGFRDRLRDLIPKMSTERFRDGFRKWGQSSVGRKLLVDATKAFFKRQLKNAEMAAWMEYIQLEAHGQGWFGIWQAAANAYWEADDDLLAMMLEKDRIMEGFDFETAVGSPKLQEKFKTPSTLRIRLLVPHSARPFAEIPVQVWVNGVQTRRSSATVFEISTKQLSGTEFAIEVR